MSALLNSRMIDDALRRLLRETRLLFGAERSTPLAYTLAESLTVEIGGAIGRRIGRLHIGYQPVGKGY